MHWALRTRRLESLVVVDNATGSPPARFVADHVLLSTTVDYVVSGDNISSDGGSPCARGTSSKSQLTMTGSSHSMTMTRRGPPR